MTNSKTIRSQVWQLAPAEKRADMVPLATPMPTGKGADMSELQADTRTMNLALMQRECRTGK